MDFRTSIDSETEYYILAITNFTQNFIARPCWLIKHAYNYHELLCISISLQKTVMGRDLIRSHPNY